MGVIKLWNILEPVKKTGDLLSLSGKILCVDLSVWICEAHGAKGLKANVLKPHLRNLFFRVCNLMRSGVKLVFVVDGEPPKVKWEAILKRAQARRGLGGKEVQKAKAPSKVGRSRFRVWVNEYVDGCITNDGDVLLYGGLTVYKDICITAKECSVECYSMQDIENNLGLTRTSLISLAILLGCDYLPQGVPGVGKETSIKLIQELNGIDILDRFNKWSTFQIKDGDMSKIERNVKQKALKIPGFPNHEVINEFLSPKLNTKSFYISTKYACPDLKGAQEFCLKHLEWPEEYTTDKMLPLLTYWQMSNALECSNNKIIPERVVKPRVQNKVECYEIQWRNNGIGDCCPLMFTSIETKKIFEQAYPTVHQSFEAIQLEKKTKKQGKTKNKKTANLKSASSIDSLDNLCENLNTLSLQTTNQEGALQHQTKTGSRNKGNIEKDNSNIKEEKDITVSNEEDSLEIFSTSESIRDIPLTLSNRISKKCSIQEFTMDAGKTDDSSSLASKKNCLLENNSDHKTEVKLQDSFEMPLPLSERLSQRKLSSKKIRENTMKKNDLPENDVTKLQSVNDFSSFFDEILTTNTEPEEAAKTQNCVWKPNSAENHSFTKHSIAKTSEEKYNHQYIFTPQEKTEQSKQNSKKTNVPQNTTKVSKTSKTCTNTKRKPRVTVEFSSSEDEDDSWLLGKEQCIPNCKPCSPKLVEKKLNIGLEEKSFDDLWLINNAEDHCTTNCKPSTPKQMWNICCEENISDVIFGDVENNKAKSYQSSSKQGCELTKPVEKQLNVGREETFLNVLKENKEVYLAKHRQSSNKVYDKSASKLVEQKLTVGEEEVFLNILKEDKEVYLTNHCHSIKKDCIISASKLVEQKLSVDEEDWYLDVFNDDMTNGLLTGCQQSNKADKKGHEKPMNSDIKNGNEKNNCVESPLFVPLPLSERIKIRREKQSIL